MKRCTNLLKMLSVFMSAVLLMMLACSCGDSGSKQTTRADLEDAVMETAWAYYLKYDKVQYDSQELNVEEGTDGSYTNHLRKFYGGAWRTTLYSTLEDATSDNTVYTVCSDFPWSVYKNTLDYSLFGHRLSGITNGLWMFSEREDMLVMRYYTDEYPTKTNLRYAEFDKSYRMDLAETEEFLRNYEVNLRPGDILISTGHTELYLGNNYVIDSWGSKYNMSVGGEFYETDGTIEGELHTLTGIYVDGTEQKAKFKLSNVDFFAVIRPLNALCIDDGDDDPSNDLLNTEYVQPQWDDMKYPEDLKTTGFDIIPAAADRLKYPGIGIDRTVDITPYGTAEEGGTLTYEITITNGSSTEDYCTWRSAYYGKTYTGENYKNIRITETVPAGTELVSSSIGSGKVDGDTITWEVDISAGESVTVSYTVTVTAGQGEVITNGGGYVGDTPSNTITNTVGGAKLSDERMAALAQFASAKRKVWSAANEEGGYNISTSATDTRFAERIYERVLGLGLELPSIEELMNGLFEQTLIQEESGWYIYGEKAMDPVYMYTLCDTVPEDYQIYRDMIVPGYLGGVYVYTDAYAGELRINEFSTDYMEPGDILLMVDMTDYSASGAERGVSSGMTVVYLGDGRYAVIDSDGNTENVNTDARVWKAFSYDFFICLRPSLAYKDVNALPAYDMANEPVDDTKA